ncbi:MAG: patatin-like phospholipase family protein [Hydrogenophaga sp.]|uniref:patatin-like phospholipase family protein n=1 Tax=Hydrogenophaga sp. TaxID=1904254 RepID=UPI0025BF8C85|nr:patatin-like phospholipase family protein [Hydrogenophaga sp.]MBT9553549.1 patatin-like phospholipase family protein [Hydrogenophaga sp.]
MNEALIQRMQAPGPKKILACDGGGILGLMSVEILAKLEDDLRTRLGKGPDFVLADYFDFVCGTSTGAIIAACVSCGMSMSRIRQFYEDSGEQMFDKAFLLRRLNYKYNDEPLATLLRIELGKALGDDPTLGSPGLRTLLMMVMRNATTDSPWPISNNPFAGYNQLARKDCNLRLPLWQLVRASTAAPTFFPPEIVTLAEGTPDAYTFIFVDGGVTTYNNPAFLAFQMATAAPYAVNWATGADRLLVVSVGTGGAAKAQMDLEASDMHIIYNASTLPGALMNAAAAGWDMACRMLGDCRFGGRIDREFGSMLSDAVEPSNWSGPKLFAYARYDPDVTPEGLSAMGLPGISTKAMQEMDSVKHMPDIQRVGREFALRHVSLEHLRGFC